MSVPLHAAPKVMTLSREEMRSRALAFAKYWKAATPREEADAKTFLDEFFEVFGRERKLIAAHPASSLADLYDPRSMPPNLRAAHNALDRVAHLFRLYEQLTAPLAPDPKAAKPAKTPKFPKAKSTPAA